MPTVSRPVEKIFKMGEGCVSYVKWSQGSEDFQESKFKANILRDSREICV